MTKPLIRKFKKKEETPEIDIPLAPEEEQTGRRVLSESEKRARRARIKSFFTAFLVALVLLGAVFAVGYLYSIRDKVSARSIRNYWNSLWGIRISTDTLDWNLTDSAAFALYQGGVLAADLSGIRLIGTDGIETSAGNHSWQDPVLEVAGTRYLVFDRSDSSFFFGEEDKEILSSGPSGGVMRASLSDAGLTLIKSESGDLATVEVYSNTGKLLFEYHSTEFFGAGALLSGDGKTLTFLGLSASSTSFETTVLFLDVENAELAATVPLGEALPLGLAELSDGVFAVITDNALYSVERAGRLVGSTLFGSDTLSSYAFGNDFTALLFRRNQTGSRYKLVTYDSNSSPLGSISLLHEPQAMAAEGRLVALAYESAVDLFPAALGSHSTTELDHYVSGIALSREGTVLALSDGTLYLK